MNVNDMSAQTLEDIRNTLENPDCVMPETLKDAIDWLKVDPLKRAPMVCDAWARRSPKLVNILLAYCVSRHASMVARESGNIPDAHVHDLECELHYAKLKAAGLGW